ncbi:MAG: recombination protein RecR [Bacteroidales bacterium]|nr:recombination protein RecR [Bacteroidales bacterium]
MNVQTFPSRLLERAVDEFAKLPSIGRRTALRLVLHMLRQSPETVDRFAEAITALRHEVKFCSVCNNISDTDVCSICSNPKRDASLICVVEHIQDVMMVESTQQFNGLYHVLGGVIDPMGGVGPQNLNISSLESRIAQGGVREVILALSTTMEGDTTNFYLLKLLKPSGVQVSTLARGVSFGDELERTDEITLGRALVNRVPL